MFELKDIDIVSESTNPFRISFVPNEQNTNVNGAIHGGILFLLCDEIVGQYVTHLGKKGAAADSNIHFYRPAFPGNKITATISERKIGKRLGTYFVELTDNDNKLLADALFTVAYM